VLLHGLASNSTRWSELVALTSLTESWDLLRPDLRGNGGSVWRGRLGMHQWSADLAEILDAEGYPRALLVGHCLGANVAIEFASRHAERVTGLVLIEPMPPEALTGTLGTVARIAPLLPPAVLLVRALNALGLHRRRLEPLDLATLDRETRARMARGADAADLERRYASWRLDLRSTATGAYLQMLRAVTRPLPDPTTLRLPVLALLSSGSTFTDPAITKLWLARIPSCRVLHLDARHWIPTEQPSEMRRAIEEFCRA
jgi:pimeloyl-ACP methyl ester carboxylesterase